MPQRFVVIGNGIAGTTCAETLRAEDPSCAVTLVGLEPHPLYNRVSLPRYLKRGIPRERVILRTVEEHASRGIDLRLQRVAQGLDPAARSVHLDDGSELPYDALLVATGGRPGHTRRPVPTRCGASPTRSRRSTKPTPCWSG